MPAPPSKQTAGHKDEENALKNRWKTAEKLILFSSLFIRSMLHDKYLPLLFKELWNYTQLNESGFYDNVLNIWLTKSVEWIFLYPITRIAHLHARANWCEFLRKYGFLIELISFLNYRQWEDSFIKFVKPIVPRKASQGLAVLNSQYFSDWSSTSFVYRSLSYYKLVKKVKNKRENLD